MKIVKHLGEALVVYKNVKVDKRGKIQKQFNDKKWREVVQVFHEELKIYKVETDSRRLGEFLVVAPTEQEVYEEAIRRVGEDFNISIEYVGRDYVLELV